MWMEKICHGVLQVSTDNGERIVTPSLAERIQLVWMFRNFQILPEEVLTRHERSLLDLLCSEDRMERPRRQATAPACIIGTVERHSPVPPKRAPRPAAFGKAQARTA